jgi:hypothetical protein
MKSMRSRLAAVTVPGASSANAAEAVDAHVIDRALRVVDGLPGPAEAWFFAAGCVVALIAHVVLWLTGTYGLGQLNQEVLIATLLAGSLLALSAFMKRTAEGAFDDFRPALADTSREEAGRRALLSIPDRAAIVGSVSMAILTNTLYLVYLKPTMAPRPAVAELVVAASWLLFALVLGLVIAQTLIQLRSVRHLNEIARNIDVLDSGPVDALSRVTAVGAAGMLVFVAAANLGVPATASAFVVLDVLIIVFALSAFVLPLQVMHRRLSRQKADLLAASAQRLKVVLDALHRAIDGHDFAMADALNKMVATSIAERDLLTRLSTWPWTNATLRGFGSALLLPVVIFVITHAIDRAF